MSGGKIKGVDVMFIEHDGPLSHEEIQQVSSCAEQHKGSFRWIIATSGNYLFYATYSLYRHGPVDLIILSVSDWPAVLTWCEIAQGIPNPQVHQALQNCTHERLCIVRGPDMPPELEKDERHTVVYGVNDLEKVIKDLIVVKNWTPPGRSPENG